MTASIRTSLLVLILACVAVLAACGSELDESLTDLQVGDCVVDPGIAESEVEQLDSVDCADPGAVEVVETFDIEGDGDFPGLADVEAAAQQGCPPETTFYLYPTEESWEQADDRLVVCFQ